MRTRPCLALLLASLSLTGPLRAADDEGAASYSLTPDPAIDGRARELLVSGEYDFCTRPSYRLWKEDKEALCTPGQELMDRCPGLRAACGRPAWEEQFEPQEPVEEGWFVRSLRWLAEAIPVLGHAVFWVLLAALVAMVVLFLLRTRWRRRPSEAPTVPAELTRAEETVIEHDRRSSRELSAAASALLAQGQTRAALHLFYRATVVSLAEAHLLVAHHGKTRLDYLDELEASWKPEVAELTSELESQRYQPSPPDPERVAHLGQRVNALAQRLSQALPLLLSLLCLSCVTDDLPEPPTSPTGPRGHQLLERLLDERAESVSRRLRELNGLDEEVGVVVLLGAKLRQVEWNVLLGWVERGGHLVMSGSDPLFASTFALKSETEPCAAAPSTRGVKLVAVGPQLGLLQDPGIRLASCGERALASNFERGSGYVTWLPNESWFENGSLGLGNNATWVLDLVAPEESHVELLGSWTGQGAHHPLESLMRAGLGPWALQLMVLSSLYAWARGRRFGSARDPIEERRRTFREHAEALSAQYARAHASGFVLARYAEWAFELLRRRVASSEDNPRSLGRALSPAGEKESALARNLTLARKADELGEDEARHVSRFRALDDAVRKHGR